jgi:hypothetical protein
MARRSRGKGQIIRSTPKLKRDCDYLCLLFSYAGQAMSRYERPSHRIQEQKKPDVWWIAAFRVF